MNITEKFVELKTFVCKSFFKEKKNKNHLILFDQVIEIKVR